MRTDKRSGLRLVIGLLFAVAMLLISFPLSWWADYTAHRDRFSYSVYNQDRTEARKGLETLKEDYRLFTKWKLGYLADKYLFDRMHLYEAAVSILNEDFEKVEKEDLKNRESWEVSYMLGVSRFWILHEAFQQAMAKKDKAKMSQILEIVVDRVKIDFQKCVNDGPGPVRNFNCSFDYDLVSDPKSAMRALSSPKPKVKYLVGPSGEKPGPGKAPGKKGPPQVGPGSGNEAGQGGARKVG